MHIICKNKMVSARKNYIRCSDSHGSGLVLNMVHKVAAVESIKKLPCCGDKLSNNCTNIVGGFYNKNSPERNAIRTNVKSIAINPIETGGGSLLSKVKIPLMKDKLGKKENRNNIKFII